MSSREKYIVELEQIESTMRSISPKLSTYQKLNIRRQELEACLEQARVSGVQKKVAVKSKRPLSRSLSK